MSRPVSSGVNFTMNSQTPNPRSKARCTITGSCAICRKGVQSREQLVQVAVLTDVFQAVSRQNQRGASATIGRVCADDALQFVEAVSAMRDQLGKFAHGVSSSWMPS